MIIACYLSVFRVVSLCIHLFISFTTFIADAFYWWFMISAKLQIGGMGLSKSGLFILIYCSTYCVSSKWTRCDLFIYLFFLRGCFYQMWWCHHGAQVTLRKFRYTSWRMRSFILSMYRHALSLLSVWLEPNLLKPPLRPRSFASFFL